MNGARHLFHGSGSLRTVKDHMGIPYVTAGQLNYAFGVLDILQEGNLLYANTEKSPSWLRVRGLQLPGLVTKKSFLLEKSISEKLSAVNNPQFSICPKRESNEEVIRRSDGWTEHIIYEHDKTTHITKNQKGEVMSTMVKERKKKGESIWDSIRESVWVSKVDDIQAGMKQPQDNKGKKPHITVEEKVRTDSQKFGMLDTVLHSPSYVAEKYARFRGFFRLGAKAMDKQEYLRNKFDRHLKRMLDPLQTKEEKKLWNTILYYR